MAQCEEDIVQNTTMADDVVCISDDDERDDDPSTSARSSIRQMGAHSNTYENETIGLAVQSLRTTLGLSQSRQAQNENESTRDEVIYVPDDNDEESFIIGPIRKICMKIIFGRVLKAPTEFPYELLQEIDAHMEHNVKGVSQATVKCVWECVLEQLSIMRITYSPHIDVCSICANTHTYIYRMHFT